MEEQFYFPKETGIHYIDDIDGNHVPVITLEVMTASDFDQLKASELDHIPTNEEPADKDPGATISEDAQNTRVHFLADSLKKVNITTDRKESTPRKYADYMIRYNGTVVCKLCGEILKNRTHFYRHKTKRHFVPSLNPAPLFQCVQCLVFFKSRKGYHGHMAARHSHTTSESTPSLPSEEAPTEKPAEIKEEPDIEMAIPASSVANCKTTSAKSVTKCPEAKRFSKFIKGTITEVTLKDREERRSREEKLVADIIDRVKRECEAQGTGGATRKGYTRRTTVMHV